MQNNPQTHLIFKHSPIILNISIICLFFLGCLTFYTAQPLELNILKISTLLLGLFFIGFGIFVFLLKSKQTIVFDNIKNTLTLSHKNFFSDLSHTINFQDIKNMEVIHLEYLKNYDIEITLKNGTQFCLFLNGFYGQTSKKKMEERLHLIDKFIYPKNANFIETKNEIKIFS